MEILIDANVVITYITDREDKYHDESIAIMRMCAEGSVHGRIAFHTLSIISYIFRKNPSRLQCWLRNICSVAEVTGASHRKIMEAIDRFDFLDFEDNLQAICAEEAMCDYIVTGNIKDFATSGIPAITPDDFLKLMREKLST